MTFDRFNRLAGNVVQAVVDNKKRPSTVPRLEWFVGCLTGIVLEDLALRAKARGDLHEFNHIMAAISVGNSVHEYGFCAVPDGRIMGIDEPVVFTVDSVTGYSARKAQEASRSAHPAAEPKHRA